MSKIVRLTESDLNKIVKKVMKEQKGNNPPFCNSNKADTTNFNYAWNRVSRMKEPFTMKEYTGDIQGNYVVIEINAMRDDMNPCMIEKKYLFTTEPIPVVATPQSK
jgi:hypothetical protein